MRSSRSTRQPEPLDRRRSLHGIPVVHENVTVDRREQTRLVLTVRTPQRRRGWLARLRPPVEVRLVRLDELGSFVFEQLDGHRNVLALADRFVCEYKVSRREAELSVVAFLKSLVRRNVVSIAIP